MKKRGQATTANPAQWECNGGSAGMDSAGSAVSCRLLQRNDLGAGLTNGESDDSGFTSSISSDPHHSHSLGCGDL